MFGFLFVTFAVNNRSLPATAMKDRKEYILEKAFKVFMNRGYDSVSITVLQKELGMSRGAMYRYFSSKDELFFEVIDKYLMGLLQRMMPQVSEETTLAGLIEQLYRHQKKIIHALNKESIQSNFFNFTALMIQGAKHYPGFIERVKELAKQRHALWARALRNSIAKGEVRSDIEVNVMAGIFAAGIDYPETAGNVGEAMTKTAENWKRAADYLYSMIKI